VTTNAFGGSVRGDVWRSELRLVVAIPFPSTKTKNVSIGGIGSI
jgi:hypothetical protein